MDLSTVGVIFICFTHFLLCDKCYGVCVLQENLPAQNQSGSIVLDNTEDNQVCQWKLPNHKYGNDVLFLHIPPFNFYNDSECTADISLDSRTLSCRTYEPMCILYKVNLEAVNFSYVKSQTKYFICKTWRVEEEKSLNTIKTRMFQNVNIKDFSIQYQYISVHQEEQGTGPTTLESTTSVSSPNTYKEKCTPCTGYVVALSFTALIILLMVLAGMIFHLYTKRTMVGKRQPRIRGSFFQTESIDDDVHGPLSSPIPRNSIFKSVKKPRGSSESVQTSIDHMSKNSSATTPVDSKDSDNVVESYYQIPMKTETT